MRQSFLLIFFALLLMACQSDGDANVRDRARAAVEQQAVQPASTTPAASTSSTDPLPVQPTPPTVDDQLTLSLGNGRGTTGDTICLPVSVKGFQDLLGWQYTMRWNPEELAFYRVQEFNLVDLNEVNFGLTNVARGFLINSWIDNSLRGQSIDDGRVIYEVCFALTGASGTRAEVRFDQNPAPFEVINTQEEILRFNGQTGVIAIE